MPHSQQEVLLSKIYLDNENPRHDPLATESDIIKYLLSNEDVRQLAKSIASLGGTSPLELVGLFPHPKAKGFFTPAEGNRRICALKLLADPDKADTEKNRKYFASLQAQLSKPIKSINAIVFDSRAEPRPWVELRHAGQQNGVGTKPWVPQQKERFDRDGTGKANPNTLASLIIDYATKHKLLPAAQLEKLSLTTLTRYLSNPVMRDVLGLVDNRSLQVTVPPEEFNTVVIRFLGDSLKPGSGVDSRTSADQRRKYANKLRTQGVAPETRDQEPVDLTDVAPRKKAATTSTSKKRNNANRDKAQHVIPADFRATIRNPILRRLVDELRTLPAEEYSFAAAYLVRAVIEQITVLFLKKKGIGAPDELHAKLLKMADILESQGVTPSQLKPLRTMGSDRHSRHSAETMGHFVHGGAVPTRVDSIKTWDSIEPMLTVAINQL